jgi:hypothetical protein
VSPDVGGVEGGSAAGVQDGGGVAANVYPPAVFTRLTLPRRPSAIGETVGTIWRRVHKVLNPQKYAQEEGELPVTGPANPPNWGATPDGIGICLSGGGVRSASYCLGALQAMGQAEMLFGRDSDPNRAKYLSAVSGGSYIATAFTLVSKGPVDGAARFGDNSVDPFEKPAVDTDGSERPRPPDMRPFAPGTPEENHVRNHTLYLTEAKGGIPGTIWRAVLGVLLNVLLMAWIVGTVALPLGWLYGAVWPGLRADCPEACSNGGSWSVPSNMWIATAAAGFVAVITGFVWIALRFRRDWKRTAWGSVSGTFLVVCFLLLILGVAIPEIIHLARPVQLMTTGANAAKKVTVAGSTAGLVALIGTWIASARRIVSNASGVEKAAINSGKGLISKYRNFFLKVAAFLGGPVLLFSTVTIVTFYGSGFPPGVSGSNGRTVLIAWGSATVVLGLLWRRADVTTWSLYPFYRRRLSAAYVLGRTYRKDSTPPSPTAVGHDDAAERPYAATYPINDCQPKNTPELLVCAAANISDKGATPSGSRVTSFVFSKDWIGGPLVGAVSSEEYKNATGSGPESRFATLPTAMALSGAALSPSMGKMTRPWLRLYMVIANLRLGVWIPNPRRMDDFRTVSGRRGHRLLPRPDYLLREIFGRNHLDAPYLYVTDGGHYENLGLVELLRRKCETIWCIDASGDQIDTFGTIGGAFRTAGSELGVRFDIDPNSAMAPTGDRPPPAKPWYVKSPYCGGDFTYGDGTKGRLIIVKAGVPQNAPWSVRSYQSEHPNFPCDPTLDQLFDGERFDAYRELGRYSVEQALNAFTPNGALLH